MHQLSMCQAPVKDFDGHDYWQTSGQNNLSRYNYAPVLFIFMPTTGSSHTQPLPLYASLSCRHFTSLN